MTLNLQDLVQRNVYLGSYEFNETAWVREILRPGDMAIDVGANCGYYTTLFAQIVGPSGSVIALEPNPSLAGRLDSVIAFNRLEQVSLIQAGASEAAGNIALYIPPSTWHNEDATMVRVDGWSQVNVSVIRLDDLLAESGNRSVKLLKLDIEGHEYRALCGAEANLRAGRVDYILTELNEYWLNEHSTSSRALVELCGQFGFKIVRGTLPQSGGTSSVLLQHHSVSR